MKANDEKRDVVPTKIMNDPKEQDDGIKNSKLAIVIPKFIVEEDDELEEFKTPSSSEFRIPPSLECPPTPKRKSMTEKRPTVLSQFPVICFLESLYEKFSKAYKKHKRN